MLARLYYSGLRATGLIALTRRLRRGGLVLCYHNVVPSRAATVGDRALHIPLDRFKAQVSWLAGHYEVVPLRELIHRLRAGRDLRRVAALSFDDAYAGFVRYGWPLLRARGLPATAFVVAGAPERQRAFRWDRLAEAAPLRDWEQGRPARFQGGGGLMVAAPQQPAAVRLPPTYLPAGWSELRAAAAAGLDIGAHSVTHRMLTWLDAADLERELAASREVIEERTGVRPDVFAYPYGVWDQRVRDAAERAGYHAALTLDGGLNTAATDRWALRRLDVPSGIPLDTFQAWIAGLRAPTLLRR